MLFKLRNAIVLKNRMIFRRNEIPSHGYINLQCGHKSNKSIIAKKNKKKSNNLTFIILCQVGIFTTITVQFAVLNQKKKKPSQ